MFDQTLALQVYQSAKDYPKTFRSIRYKDPETGKRLRLITNNTALSALSICSLYKPRWQVEFLPLDQSAFARKGILRNVGKSCEVTNLDRRTCLSARRDYQEMPQRVTPPVRNTTDFDARSVRKNPLDPALSRMPIVPEADQDNNQLILL